MSLRYLYRRAWYGSAEERLLRAEDCSLPNVHAHAEDAECRTSRPLCDQDRLERRTQYRHLFLRASAQDLSLRGMQGSLITQGRYGIDLCCPARWNVSSRNRDGAE